jgi:hypothetical protein
MNIVKDGREIRTVDQWLVRFDTFRGEPRNAAG